MVVFPARIHPPPALVAVRQRDHQIWQGIHVHRQPAIFNIYPPITTPTIILFRRRTDANSRRWDSNAETFRTRNYDFDSDDNDDGDFEVDDDDENEWLDILEDFIDGVWIFKAFRSFGWMLPAIISSLLLTSGPKAFLMALAIPVGQSALSLLFQTVWGRPKKKTKRRGTSKRRAPSPPPRANSYVDIDDEEEYVKDDRKRATGYQTWVAGDGSSDKKSNNSSSSFGGWEELDGRATPNRKATRKTTKSKISRRDRRSDTPLLLRLLIAVFPFLGSWTKMI